jgi:nucleotide-binding universal stress UspA family protein
VRQRTRGGYARIVVANDFSSSTRRALDTALRLFPGRRITLLHVLESGTGALTEVLAAAAEDGLARGRSFLDGCGLPPESRALLDVAVTQGKVAEAVARYALENLVQLVVLGVRPRSGMARVFMGSRSEDLLQHLACDILLVREEGGGDG